MVNISWKQAFWKYPDVIHLTVIQLAVAEIIALPILICNGVKLGEITHLLKQRNRFQILVVGTSFAVGQMCTNASLSTVSVSLTHIIKITEPLIALFFGITILKDKVKTEAALYMCIMMIGVAIATVYDTTFYPKGMIFAGLSSIALQVRNLYIKLIHKEQNIQVKSITMFFLSNTVALQVLFILAVLKNIRNYSRPSFFELDHSAFMTGIWFAGQHIMSYFVLQNVLISTHAVLNVIKRIVIIVVCALLLHTYVSLHQFVGIGIAFIGFFLYTITMKKATESEGTVCKSKIKIFLWIICGVCMLLLCSPNFHPDSKAVQQETPVTACWPYAGGLDKSSISLLQSLYTHSPQRKITVYCGSSKCQNSLKHMGEIEIKQLHVLTLTRGTPMSHWVRRHSLMKILTGPDFESYLQKALNLALLWKTGGIVLDLDVQVKNIPYFVSNLGNLTNNTCILGTAKQPIGICNLRKHHPFVEHVIKEFTAAFGVDEKTKWPLKFDFGQVLYSAFNSFKHGAATQDQLKNVTELYTGMLIPFKRLLDHKQFGLVHYTESDNIGDEVQSIASAHFLPHIDVLLPRASKKLHLKEETTVILNAFWRVGSWLSSTMSKIKPVPVAMHLAATYSQNLAKLRSKKDYFLKHGPIGTRDVATLHLLQKFNISAKFTGCVTPFLQNPHDAVSRSNIYLMDVDPHIKKIIPSAILDKAISLKQKVSRKESNGLKRYVDAYHLLEKYAQAKVVITTRIHTALPCVAFGTPVIFLNLKTLNDATPQRETPRVTGLTSLFHTIDEYKQTPQEIKAFLQNFDYENPPANPNPDQADSLRKAAWSILGKVEDIRFTHNLYSLRP